ncbi:hypothetical protein DNTS_030039 [Danionella cerebrum]|uniref:Tumor protein p53-inducible protein 13 n=1 Tax=Danionella cerebrum TaxID=2873325 RepID=A0A553R2A4_9TELE|nr:hypothetical protein DNTS_030039 [Danionella translucida]
MARPVLLLSGFICLCMRCSSSWLCDNGKNIPDIKTWHSTTEATDYICMDTPIRYNEHIPTHGAYRFVEAESGEYLYCPPQRWLHNLKNGALVFLYHPCLSVEARRRLTVMAHSCHPHYIITAHPGLSQNRPFAVVSWGRSLEMSRITHAVCDWIRSVSSNVSQALPSYGAKYNLYLIKPMAEDRPVNAKQEMSKAERLKSLEHCCMEALSFSESKMVLKRSLQQLTGNIKPDELNSTDGTKENNTDIIGQNGTKVMVTVTQSHSSASYRTKTAEKPKEPTTKKVHQGTTTKGRKHRIKTDTKAQLCGELEPCGLAKSTPPRVEDQIRGERIPLPRTDEAVWAAGAVGFILALLTLSVLHTRLYRHCRPSTSLYWHDNQQDYENVSDIIRRRLRNFGRRKRRSSQSRRLECSLLSNSSNDENSD